MTWVKVDDALWRHRKIAAISDDKVLPCLGLWALALSWVGANLTDGYVSDRGLLQVAGSDVSVLADELVRVGLWERVDGGYLFHDYLSYNPTSDEVITARSVREEAARKAGRARAAGARRTNTGRFTSADAGKDAGDGTSAATNVRTTPVSRIPYPVNPVPVSHIASAGADAIDESETDFLEEAVGE